MTAKQKTKIAKTKNVENNITEKVETNSGKIFLIWVGIIIGLFVVAIGFGAYQANRTINVEDIEMYDYNGFSFSKQGVLWKTTVYKYSFINDTNANMQEVPFFSNYDPKSIEHISLSGDVSQIINETTKIFLSFDTAFGQSMSLAGIEIGKVLVSFYNWKADKIIVGINVDEPGSGFPYIDCSNATNGAKVIKFNFGNDTSITQDGDCYQVLAKESKDIVRAADLIMFKLLGIIK